MAENQEVKTKETKDSAVKDTPNQEKIDIIKEQINKVMDADLLEKVIQDNKLEFTQDNVTYRVTVPSYEQKQVANEKRLAKYLELLKNPNIVMEEELRKLYKAKGVDIDAMDKQFNALGKKKEDYMYKLGAGLKEKKADAELQIYKDEIEKITREQQEVAIKKTTLLEYSLEHQIMIYVYAYLTYLIAEKKVEEKWVPVWESYESFMKDKTLLVNTVTFYASLLISNELSIK